MPAFPFLQCTLPWRSSPSWTATRPCWPARQFTWPDFLKQKGTVAYFSFERKTPAQKLKSTVQSRMIPGLDGVFVKSFSVKFYYATAPFLDCRKIPSGFSAKLSQPATCIICPPMAAKFHTCSLICIFVQVHAPAKNNFYFIRRSCGEICDAFLFFS